MDLFKSDTIPFFKVFQWLVKLKFLSFETTGSSNNKNETKSEIFYRAHHFSIITKYGNISMTFVIGVFQFHDKSEHKQVK